MHMTLSYRTATVSIAETSVQSLKCHSHVIQQLAIDIIQVGCTEITLGENLTTTIFKCNTFTKVDLSNGMEGVHDKGHVLGFIRVKGKCLGRNQVYTS